MLCSAECQYLSFMTLDAHILSFSVKPCDHTRPDWRSPHGAITVSLASVSEVNTNNLEEMLWIPVLLHWWPHTAPWYDWWQILLPRFSLANGEYSLHLLPHYGLWLKQTNAMTTWTTWVSPEDLLKWVCWLVDRLTNSFMLYFHNYRWLDLITFLLDLHQNVNFFWIK